MELSLVTVSGIATGSGTTISSCSVTEFFGLSWLAVLLDFELLPLFDPFPDFELLFDLDPLPFFEPLFDFEPLSLAELLFFAACVVS